MKRLNSPMTYRINFIENGKAFHTFIDAANGADAAETVTMAFEALDREIEITDFHLSDEPNPMKPSTRLKLIDRELKNETRVALNDG